MTHLDLTGNRNTLTDLVVQTIVSKMRKQVLELSHGSCTDFAFTGVPNGKLVGMALTDLKCK